MTCTCSGMSFISNKWVFTGTCSCPPYEYVGYFEDFHVGVDKVGGGTVGTFYTRERWEVSFRKRGSHQWTGPEDLYVGRSATHSEVAVIARDFYDLREMMT